MPRLLATQPPTWPAQLRPAWGRSVADSNNSIHELTALGVRFIAVPQNIDTDESNPMARFLLQIMAAFAELGARSSGKGWSPA